MLEELVLGTTDLVLCTTKYAEIVKVLKIC